MKLEMASSHCSDSSAKSHHFFKIILSDTDSLAKLMIPKKFVRKYGKNLDSLTSLKVPNGLAWPVNLERHEGNVWIQKGWPEFARFYSIQFGHMLVFEYRGHCDVKVHIFDSSCTEIDYPAASTSAKLHIGESSQVRKRKPEIDHLASSDLIRPRKKRVEKLTFKSASQNGVGFMPKLQQEKGKLGNCALASKKAEARALSSAEAFKSDHPFFFHVMRKTHVDRKRRGLIVRRAFEESYKKWKHNDQVHLQVAGKSWLVNCDMKWNRCRLGIGWDRFAKDNSLKVGDVCVFELIDACKKFLQVVIFRAAKGTNGDGGSAIEEAKSKAVALASAKDFESRNPCFVVTMKESYVDGRGSGMSVPQKFIKSYITNDSCNVTLQISGGRAWSVKCNVYDSSIKFGVGWKIFARANHLAVGDVCVFELINFSEKLLNVVIFRNETSNYK